MQIKYNTIALKLFDKCKSKDYNARKGAIVPRKEVKK